MKLLLGTILTLIILSGLTLFDSSKAFAQSGLVVVIDFDTTWTKADSPHELNAPVLVNEGIILTIEAGTTVNLNGYYIMVNGTLRLLGNIQDKIFVNNGRIIFTQFSSNWDENTGSGSIIENSNLESIFVEISSVSPKIVGNSILNLTVGGSSIVSNNSIFGPVYVELNAEKPIFSHNIILGDVNCASDGSSVFSFNTISGNLHVGLGPHIVLNNTISGEVSLNDSPIIANNTISGGISVKSGSPKIVKNYISEGINKGETLMWGGISSALISQNFILGEVNIRARGETTTISNNEILGKISVTNGKITISGNSITGQLDMVPKGKDPVIEVSIENNMIIGEEYGIYIEPAAGWPLHLHYTSAIIQGNLISGCSNAAITVGGSQIYDVDIKVSNVVNIEGNIIINNNIGITGELNEPIKNNIIVNNTYGIVGGSLIELNTIANNTYGISEANEIRNNTIINNFIGVEGDFTTFLYNNIYNNSEYNFRFISSNNRNATNNWWGTTDTNAINQTIYDYKYDFKLGKLNFTPFLTEENPNSEPKYTPQIPEFASWTVLPLFLGVAVVIAVFRGKLLKSD
ncbi:MAG: hypothetical protein QCH99_00435 [Candidatus Bathyarchaeota archaeon]|nr:hypothetical protein [Candidatus Bathyarchaeum tardum]WGM89471.1 MAG: hypothetical protein NUK63_11320 [Candidatus Bathyarchaeum tardum]